MPHLGNDIAYLPVWRLDELMQRLIDPLLRGLQRGGEQVGILRRKRTAELLAFAFLKRVLVGGEEGFQQLEVLLWEAFSEPPAQAGHPL